MSIVSALVASILVAVGSSTAARQPPPHGSVTAAAAHVRVIRLRPAADARTRTCNARAPRDRAGRVERQLAPVACEQPPRSQVGVDLSGGLGALLGH